ncbi:efflux RND transporter periplasmic adaptor subunit [Alteromonas sp. ASW11-130]|uniref:efflux RND transporter periplasmic adaptor subunit n=1 Tax=Alteromonas sp. ASW11-130 TaxID=3015775 RepID=UPI002241C49D|nr:efflux RND transporter periplasmic adaptor subunit [Alteromonas sp. ASW11-130]MCW8091090.1 efflux RND transporter periplasmic adaptor subunit [Alteromonas sp. ASW11-130]
MYKFYRVITVFAVSLLVACAEESGPQQSRGQNMPPPAVSVMELTRQNVTLSTTLPGRVVPSKQAHVRPQVDGVVVKRLFEEGAKVKKGQQLYQIDDARYRAQYNSAKADLESAQANLETLEARAGRYKNLISKNAISEQENDDVIAQLAQAKAAISVAKATTELAKVNLDYTKVYAPIDGEISRSEVTEGALVNANQAQQMATITQLDPVFVDIQSSGKEVLEIRKMMRETGSLPVDLVLNNLTGERYAHQAQLKFSEVTVDESTGAVTLRAVAPNPEGLLMPGMFVKAEIQMSSERALLLPQRATTRKPDGSLVVFIVNNANKVEARAVSVKGNYRDQYVVHQGVSEGESIIVTGYQKVQPGMDVSPQPWGVNSSGKSASSGQ